MSGVTFSSPTIIPRRRATACRAWPKTDIAGLATGDTGRQHMAEVINSLPYGENTAVFKQFREGQDPATGQRPHIGVARGIFRDAAVLVADEPTAALDVRTEPARSPA